MNESAEALQLQIVSKMTYMEDMIAAQSNLDKALAFERKAGRLDVVARIREGYALSGDTLPWLERALAQNEDSAQEKEV